MGLAAIKADHERAFHAMAARHELPGGAAFMIDPESGLLSAATIWVHGDVWFIDHYTPDHPHYRREYRYALHRPGTFFRSLKSEGRQLA